MNRWLVSLASITLLAAHGLAESTPARAQAIDRGGYDPASGVAVDIQDQRIMVQWPLGQGDETGRLVIDVREGKPLVAGMLIASRSAGPFEPIIERVDPQVFVVVGERRGTSGRPPGMSDFNEFFDSPASRPSQANCSRRAGGKARVFSHGLRATVAVEGLSAEPFRGEWQISVHAGARLVHLEAVVTTAEERRAFLYDLGLMSEASGPKVLAWTDTEGALRKAEPAADVQDRPVAVRHRAIVAEGPGGSVACFPPPHQYFFPRDLTDNQATVWYGGNHRGLDRRFGFGIRQTERGGGAYVPWFNAPPGNSQRLGAFFLITRGDARDAVKETLRYTHGDRFPALEGHHTFASHFHMAMSVAALDRQKRGMAPVIPDAVTMFKDMGVEMVHLAEFHGDGHPDDPGPVRQLELQTMFDECRRLSGDGFLLIPGEEANVYLGMPAPGRHPGHWLYMFPRPVAWTMKRESGQAIEEAHPAFGSLHHVGDRADMLRLLEREDGLAWTAHARIKASSWAPDAYRDEDFFRSDHWLGAAWKAMPADLSHDRLGRRVLDLLDDMANWGARKQVIGEVDVFKLDHTHELYGHMNVNYVRLDGVPAYEDGWKPLLQSLRGGRFFVTTGEILIPEFTIEGRESGSSMTLPDNGEAELRASLRWTFPLAFAEVISGDGANVYRQRIDLSDTPAFGRRQVTLPLNLSGRTWVRLEAWDIACNGAFTQPVWLTQPGNKPAR